MCSLTGRCCHFFFFHLFTLVVVLRCVHLIAHRALFFSQSAQRSLDRPSHARGRSSVIIPSFPSSPHLLSPPTSPPPTSLASFPSHFRHLATRLRLKHPVLVAGRPSTFPTLTTLLQSLASQSNPIMIHRRSTNSLNGLLFPRECIDCPSTVPSCNCGITEECIITSRYPFFRSSLSLSTRPDRHKLTESAMPAPPSLASPRALPRPLAAVA